MKPLPFYKALLLASFISAGGINPAQAGVSVGNAAPLSVSYWSPQGNFGVQYVASLSLKVLGDGITISNDKLIQNDQPVSTISFTSAKDVVKDLNELTTYLQQRYPMRDFSALAFPGAQGFASEIISDTRLDGLYFLLTSNGDLVQVTVDAYSVGNGLAWVAPIVHSFAYDNTPPTIQGVRVDSKVWKTGTTQKVYVHANDDNAGLSLAASNASLTLKANDQIWMQSPLAAKDEGQGWYSLPVTVSRFQTPGLYCLNTIQVADRASNYAFLKVDEKHPTTYRYIGNDVKGSPTDIQVVCVTVQNSGRADSTPPRLREVRSDRAVWDTNQTYRIHLRITDSGSGVNLDSLECWGGYSNYTCSDPRADGGDWYSLKVTPNRYLPDGKVNFSGIWVEDRAGNSIVFVEDPKSPDLYFYFRPGSPTSAGGWKTSTVSVFHQEIKNTIGADTMAPEVFEIQTSHVWKAGTKARLRYHARDVGSGIALKSANSDDHVFSGWIVSSTGDGGSFPFDAGTAVSEGNDWYHVEVFVNPFLASGEYFLWLFTVEDKAQNKAEFDCSLDGKLPPKPGAECVSKNGAKVTPVHFEIVR